MSQLLQMRRTGADVALGGLLVVAGLVILGNAAFATTVSVLFLGWMLLFAGLIALVGALFRIGTGGLWSAALSGAVLVALGLMFLRHTEAATVTLTLIAGTVFLISGIVRLVLAAEHGEHRAALVFSGIVSAVLGLIVVFNLFDASLVLLGFLLGVQILVDGITMMIVGRPHLATAPGAMTAAP